MKNRCQIVALGLLWLFALLPFRASAQVTITQQPLGANVLTGAPLSLSVQATGTGPLSYQWRVNGTNIADATNATLLLTGVPVSSSGNYSVVVSNDLGSVSSATVVLTVRVPPAIVQQPVSLIITQGGSARFTVGANGDAPRHRQPPAAARTS